MANISVSQRISLKNRDKDYYGIAGMNISYGKDVVMTVPAIVLAIAIDLFSFAYRVGLLSVDDVNNQVKEIGEKLVSLSGGFSETPTLDKAS